MYVERSVFAARARVFQWCARPPVSCAKSWTISLTEDALVAARAALSNRKRSVSVYNDASPRICTPPNSSTAVFNQPSSSPPGHHDENMFATMYQAASNWSTGRSRGLLRRAWDRGYRHSSHSQRCRVTMIAVIAAKTCSMAPVINYVVVL